MKNILLVGDTVIDKYYFGKCYNINYYDENCFVHVEAGKSKK